MQRVVFRAIFSPPTSPLITSYSLCSQVSMMHYLAAYISRKRPEAAAFVHELDFARSMSQVPIDLLFNEANVLRSW